MSSLLGLTGCPVQNGIRLSSSGTTTTVSCREGEDGDAPITLVSYPIDRTEESSVLDGFLQEIHLPIRPICLFDAFLVDGRRVGAS